MWIVLIGGDQWLKYWVNNNLTDANSVPILPHIISLTNIHNIGAAWSSFSGQLWFFFILTIIALCILGYYWWKLRYKAGYFFTLSVMIAGTVGNFIDRMLHGYVVDMFKLDFINFPIFNIADMCLTLGVIALIIVIIKDEDLKD